MISLPSFRLFVSLAILLVPRMILAGDIVPTLISNEGTVYGRLEISFPAQTTYTNPFDYDEVNAQGHFKQADGTEIVVDGFYYQDFTVAHADADKWDHITPNGDPCWRVRFTPRAPGDYTWWVTLKDSSGVSSSPPQQLKIAANETVPGFVRVASNKTNFEFSNGSSFYPIGTDLAWASRGGLFDYDRWIPLFAQNGVNAARFWLGMISFPLERMKVPDGGMKGDPGTGYVKGYLFPDLNERTQNGANDPWSGIGRYDLGNAWRIDHIVDLAHQNNMYLQICLDGFFLGGGSWKIHPYNVVNGGPCEKNMDFFSNDAAKTFFKRRLRYIVSRYGYSPQIWSWELGNEVNNQHAYPPQDSYNWHQEMTQYLKQIDPYQHLRTTSFDTDDYYTPSIDALPEIDYSQRHNYNSLNAASVVSYFLDLPRPAEIDKPLIFGEYGLDVLTQSKWSGGPVSDPDGNHLHQAFWAGLATTEAGTPMPWYWENYIEPLNLFHLFQGPALFAKDVPWNKVAWKPATGLGFRFQKPPAEGAADFMIVPGVGDWDAASAFNLPQTFTLDPLQGLSPAENSIPDILHGGDHSPRHNPLTFNVDYPAAGKLDLEVRNFSKGGGDLEIDLDGTSALKQDFPAGGADNATAAKAKMAAFNAGDFSIDIPAGKHTVVVQDQSGDWIEIGSYRFEGAVSSQMPALQAYGILGDSSRGIIYVFNRAYNWLLIDEGSQPGPIAPSILSVPGLKPGNYQVELWNTQTGTVQATLDAVASESGMEIPLPEITTDLACKIRPK